MLHRQRISAALHFSRHTECNMLLALVARPNALKFHLSTATGNIVTGLGAGWIRIGGTEYRDSLVLTPETVAPGFAASGFDALIESDFAALLAYKPEVVLFGTGAAIRFPHPALTRPLTDARVGLEVMDTPAACRTYNILAAEGRGVVAALLVK
jgi:uncharacterized protein